MNSDLVKDLEKASLIIEYNIGQTDSITVEHEIRTAMEHLKKAIEWEKNRP